MSARTGVGSTLGASAGVDSASGIAFASAIIFTAGAERLASGVLGDWVGNAGGDMDTARFALRQDCLAGPGPALGQAMSVVEAQGVSSSAARDWAGAEVGDTFGSASNTARRCRKDSLEGSVSAGVG